MSQITQNIPVLVLGSGGRLGRLLRRIWARHPPAGVDLHFQSRRAHAHPHSHQWSPGQPADTLPVCDTVIALWGQTEGDAEALALNASLAGQSRAVALACGATRLLHLSSAAIYGGAVDATETTPAAPVNDYGRAKLALEMRVAGFDDPGLRHVCLRLANVVGADSLAPALRRDTPVILDRFADGEGPLRSYIGPEDLADILIALARVPPGDLPATLNVAAPEPVAMQALTTAAGRDITWRDAPPTALQRVTMDTTHLAQLLPALNPTSDAAVLIERWQQHLSTD